MYWILFILITWLVQLVMINMTMPSHDYVTRATYESLNLRMAVTTVAPFLAAIVMLTLRKRIAKYLRWWIVAFVIWCLPSVVTGYIDLLEVGSQLYFVPLFVYAIIFPAILMGPLVLTSSPAIAIALFKMRFRRAALVLIYVEQAVRMNLPLPEMARAAAETESGKLRDRLQRVANALEQGEPLKSALARVPEFKQRDLAMIDAAERVGRLPQALAYLRARAQQSLKAGFSIIEAILLGTTLSFTLLIVLWWMIFIVPKFQRIVEDFGVALPRSTLLLVETARRIDPGIFAFLFRMFFSGWILLLAVIAALIFVRLIKIIRRHGWRVLDRVPIFGRGLRDRAWADAMFLVSQAITAGEPLHRAIALASELRGSWRVSRAMRVWASGLEQGLPSHVAAASARVPQIIGQMQLTAHLSSQPSEVFEFLARHYALKWSRLSDLIRQSVGPISVVALGLIVLWVGLATIEPLVVLIYAALDTCGNMNPLGELI